MPNPENQKLKIKQHQDPSFSNPENRKCQTHYIHTHTYTLQREKTKLSVLQTFRKNEADGQPFLIIEKMIKPIAWFCARLLKSSEELQQQQQQ